jgi:uncharacterized protein (DUF1015 family)
MKTDWDSVAIAPADILLPESGIDISAWAVVACDQYTSQAEYWREAEGLVQNKPSALRITLPEIYLAQSGERVPAIHKTMADYLAAGILQEKVKAGFMLTERTTESGSRLGLVAAADLESYDFDAGSRSMIRATEGTILSRIPPRLTIRKDAPLESTHVMLLMDDIQRTVIEPLYVRRGELKLLYDFPLMLGGGHLRGWAVTESALLRGVYDALVTLKKNLPQDNPLLMAVGDGNHSLATAKAHWLQVKQKLFPEEAAKHPARYALIEVENIHDEALQFHPIHRVVFHADGDALIKEWAAYCRERNMSLADTMAEQNDQTIVVLYGTMERTIVIKNPEASLAVGTLQKFLDDYLKRSSEAEIDYIHGEETVRNLCRQKDTVGFLVPGLQKSSLLPAVRKDGALPRKTFSMGEAHEMRYYMECRRII